MKSNTLLWAALGFAAVYFLILRPQMMAQAQSQTARATGGTNAGTPKDTASYIAGAVTSVFNFLGEVAGKPQPGPQAV